MDWKTVGKAVGKFAPLLGTALGGGPVVGGIISVVAGALGITDPDPQPDQVLQAINADPDVALKLMTVQDNNKVELERINLQNDMAYLADRQSARQRQVDSEKATGKRDYNLYALSWLNIVGFFAALVLLMFKPLPDDSSGVIFMLFGSLVAGYGMVMQYFFGSSKSSAEKTSIIAKGKRLAGIE